MRKNTFRARGVRMPDSMWEELGRVAKRKSRKFDVSKSDLVREAIQIYLIKQKIGDL